MNSPLSIVQALLSLITAACVLLLLAMVHRLETRLDEANPKPKKAHFAGHSYLLVPTPMTWEDAQAHALQKGGHLAVPNSEEENAFIARMVRDAGVFEAVWLGITDKEEEGVWKAVTSENLAFRNWFMGEPNGRHFENYANLGWSSPETWNDASAHARHAFVIEFAK